MARIPRDLISVRQADQEYGINDRTTRHWISQGRLAGYRLGPRQLRVSRAEFEALISKVPTA